MPEPSEYVMGRNERERRRLALQASVLNPLTEQLVIRAGMAPGMRVLEFGCGVGDVSMIAARLVGPTGLVTALDADPSAIEVARARAEEQGLRWIRFEQCDLNRYEPEGAFDAVVGRYILVHMKDPLATLRMAYGALRQGGVAVFHEADFTVSPPIYPESLIRAQVFERVRQFIIRATHANIGTRLYHLFLEAGFAEPNCRGETVFDSGPNGPMCEWFAETVRSLLPPMEAMGIIQPGEIEIDTLAERMRAEVISTNAGMASPLVIGGFAHKP